MTEEQRKAKTEAIRRVTEIITNLSTSREDLNRNLALMVISVISAQITMVMSKEREQRPYDDIDFLHTSAKLAVQSDAQDIVNGILGYISERGDSLGKHIVSGADDMATKRESQKNGEA